MVRFGEKKRLDGAGKLVKQMTGVEGKDVWCRFIELYEWFVDDVFLLLYLYKLGILGSVCGDGAFWFRSS